MDLNTFVGMLTHHNWWREDNIVIPSGATLRVKTRGQEYLASEQTGLVLLARTLFIGVKDGRTTVYYPWDAVQSVECIDPG